MTFEEKYKIRLRRQDAALRQTLLEKYGYACAVCGIKNDDVPLELAHIVPVSMGGETSRRISLYYAQIVIRHLIASLGNMNL